MLLVSSIFWTMQNESWKVREVNLMVVWWQLFK